MIAGQPVAITRSRSAISLVAVIPRSFGSFAAGKPCFGCDQEFFPEGHVKTNFLCNLGYGDKAKLFPRSPRFKFEDVCKIV